MHTWEAEIGAMLCSMAWETVKCAMICSMEGSGLCNVVQHGKILFVQCWAARNVSSLQNDAICSMCTVCKAALTMHGAVRGLIGGHVT